MEFLFWCSQHCKIQTIFSPLEILSIKEIAPIYLLFKCIMVEESNLRPGQIGAEPSEWRDPTRHKYEMYWLSCLESCLWH